MKQSQVDGVNVLLSWCLRPEYNFPNAWIGNVLAQAHHETGGAMQPIRETNASSDEKVMRILENWWASGTAQKFGVRTPYWRDGYFGRGFVQLTHLRNYRKMNPIVQKHFRDLDIIDNPGALCDDPNVSALIMVHGMRYGMFTGKKLPDYGEGNPYFDHEGAREIVNGDWQNFEKIGDMSVVFTRALERSVR